MTALLEPLCMQKKTTQNDSNLHGNLNHHMKGCQLPPCQVTSSTEKVKIHGDSNLLHVGCYTRIAVLSSFGRETSLVNIMGPGPYSHHCLHAQFISCFYFP